MQEIDFINSKLTRAGCPESQIGGRIFIFMRTILYVYVCVVGFAHMYLCTYYKWKEVKCRGHLHACMHVCMYVRM